MGLFTQNSRFCHSSLTIVAPKRGIIIPENKNETDVSRIGTVPEKRCGEFNRSQAQCKPSMWQRCDSF